MLSRNQGYNQYRLLISAFIITLTGHIMTLLNKTYRYDDVFLSETRYFELKRALIGHVSPTYISEPTYFNVLPSWTPNIFYAIYMLLVILAVIKFNKSALSAQ